MQPRFIEFGNGRRFCLFHPAQGGVARGAVLYVHPFAEEMNKARRMAVLQSRALAGAGYNVLQIDLLGCGDSSGDFGHADWSVWREDVLAGYRHLRVCSSAPLILWGLRAGLVHRPERRQEVHDLGAAAVGRERHAAANDFAEAGQIGAHPGALLHAAAGDPRAGPSRVRRCRCRC